MSDSSLNTDAGVPILGYTHERLNQQMETAFRAGLSSRGSLADDAKLAVSGDSSAEHRFVAQEVADTRQAVGFSRTWQPRHIEGPEGELTRLDNGTSIGSARETSVATQALDPVLQRIVELNGRNFPTSATDATRSRESSVARPPATARGWAQRRTGRLT